MRRPVHRGLDGRHIPTSLLMGMQCTLAADLIGGIGHGVRIERLPARFAVQFAALLKLYGALIHNRLDPRKFALRHPRGDQRSAAADALDKDLRVFLADAGICQRPEQAAGDDADRHAAQQSREPSGADDGADTGHCQHGEQRGRQRRRGAAVSAGAPLAAPSAAPSTLPSALLLAPSFRTGTTLAVLVALYQVSELFEITLVSDGGRPAASSMMTTRLASVYES